MSLSMLHESNVTSIWDTSEPWDKPGTDIGFSMEIIDYNAAGDIAFTSTETYSGFIGSFTTMDSEGAFIKQVFQNQRNSDPAFR